MIFVCMSKELYNIFVAYTLPQVEAIIFTTVDKLIIWDIWGFFESMLASPHSRI